MKLHYTTSRSLLDGILASGFPDGSSIRLAEGLPDRSPGLDGQAYILFDVPEEAIVEFEFDDVGTPYREFAVPVDVLNRYAILASLPGPRRGAAAAAPAESAKTPRLRRRVAFAVLMVVLAGGALAAYAATRGDSDESEPAQRATPPSTNRQVRSPEPRPRPTAERPGSVAIGSRDHGRLVRGVAFPAAGANHFTWDVVHKASPNPRRRRYGTDYVVRLVLKAVRRYKSRHPGAPKVGIGDLSRRHGGDFGSANPTHQNGLVVTVLYPRRDGGETEPGFIDEVDPQLSQALLDEFARVGATTVSVDPRLGLTIPERVTQSASTEPRMDVGFPKRR